MEAEVFNECVSSSPGFFPIVMGVLFILVMILAFVVLCMMAEVWMAKWKRDRS